MKKRTTLLVVLFSLVGGPGSFVFSSEQPSSENKQVIVDGKVIEIISRPATAESETVTTSLDSLLKAPTVDQRPETPVPVVTESKQPPPALEPESKAAPVKAEKKADVKVSKKEKIASAKKSKKAAESAKAEGQKPAPAPVASVQTPSPVPEPAQAPEPSVPTRVIPAEPKMEPAAAPLQAGPPETPTVATPSEITPVVAAPVVEPPSVVSPQMTAPETASAPVAEHQFVVAPVPTNVAPQVETPLMLTPVTVSDPVVAAPAKPSGSKPSKAVTKAPSKPAAATAKVGMISPTLSLLSEGPRYPWRKRIATTVFWVGEPPIYSVSDATNVKSAWDANWMKNFGGYDDPNPRNRKGYFPKRFQPKQNPFYVALPFNDMKNGRHKTISKKMIPWFHDEFIAQNVSVCKGRWIAIRRGGRTCYAQWEDVGPFEHDHPDYVFGTSRPRSNQNKSAGLDVSPAVRDFLRMDSGFAYTDWRFVDDDEVPKGPWLEIVNSRMSEVALFIEQSKIAAANRQQEN